MAESAALIEQSTRHALCIGTSSVFNQSAGNRVSNVSLLADITRDKPHHSGDYLPPLALIFANEATQKIEGHTDLYGLGQLFYTQAGAIAALSNSSALLAELFTTPVDRQALISFSLFGAYFDNESPFAGIHKLRANERIVLHSGKISIGLASDRRPMPSNNMARDLRDLTCALSDAFPDAEFELSGGIDSRILLAALTPERRKKHRAFTLGEPNSGDLRVARQLAAATGMEHRTFDISFVGTLDADTLHHLLSRSAERYDLSSNPIDKCILTLSNEHQDVSARFGGQNGETLRGFYYAGQNLAAKTDTALAQRLLDWRLISNEMVSPELFDNHIYEDMARNSRASMTQHIIGMDEDWAVALDKLYLFERMQRWVGNAMGGFGTNRHTLAPLFSARFVDASIRFPAKRKLNSRAAFALIAELDDGLSQVPLDTGVVPARNMRSGIMARFSDVQKFATKAAARVRRNLAGGHHRTLGSDAVASNWHQHGLYHRLPLNELAQLGIFSESALERIGSGELTLNRPSLGFVLLASQIAKLSQPKN